MQEFYAIRLKGTDLYAGITRGRWAQDKTHFTTATKLRTKSSIKGSLNYCGTQINPRQVDKYNIPMEWCTYGRGHKPETPDIYVKKEHLELVVFRTEEKLSLELGDFEEYEKSL